MGDSKKPSKRVKAINIRLDQESDLRVFAEQQAAEEERTLTSYIKRLIRSEMNRVAEREGVNQQTTA